jgi:hypothetical protein
VIALKQGSPAICVWECKWLEKGFVFTHDNFKISVIIC